MHVFLFNSSRSGHFLPSIKGNSKIIESDIITAIKMLSKPQSVEIYDQICQTSPISFKNQSIRVQNLIDLTFHLGIASPIQS